MYVNVHVNVNPSNISNAPSWVHQRGPMQCPPSWHCSLTQWLKAYSAKAFYSAKTESVRYVANVRTHTHTHTINECRTSLLVTIFSAGPTSVNFHFTRRSASAILNTPSRWHFVRPALFLHFFSVGNKGSNCNLRTLILVNVFPTVSLSLKLLYKMEQQRSICIERKASVRTKGVE